MNAEIHPAESDYGHKPEAYKNYKGPQRPAFYFFTQKNRLVGYMMFVSYGHVLLICKIETFAAGP